MTGGGGDPPDPPDPGDNPQNNLKRLNDCPMDQVGKAVIATQYKPNSSQSIPDYHNRLIKNRFRPEHKGPYFVFVEGKDNTKIGKIHPMSFGKWLFQNLNKKNEVMNIQSVGLNRIKVVTKTQETANTIVELDIFKEKNLLVYIPDFLIHKTGVVRNIDVNIDEDEILGAMDSTIPPVRMRRITRKSTNSNGMPVYFKTGTCFIEFDGQHLPDHISIYGHRCRVDPYVPPVRQCTECHRIGHIKTQCKSAARCLKCASTEHKTESCTEGAQATLPCINCKEIGHDASSKKCPVYLDRAQKKKESVQENTYATITFNNKYNALAEDPTGQEENFPELQNSNSPNNDTYKRNRRSSTRALPYKRPPTYNKSPYATGCPAQERLEKQQTSSSTPKTRVNSEYLKQRLTTYRNRETQKK